MPTPLAPVSTDPTPRKIRKELNDRGVNGSGHQIFIVEVTDAATGHSVWDHRFDTRAEALNWIKWA